MRGLCSNEVMRLLWYPARTTALSGGYVRQILAEQQGVTGGRPSPFIVQRPPKRRHSAGTLFTWFGIARTPAWPSYIPCRKLRMRLLLCPAFASTSAVLPSLSPLSSL